MLGIYLAHDIKILDKFRLKWVSNILFGTQLPFQGFYYSSEINALTEDKHKIKVRHGTNMV